jgi:Arc/MetJ-type ribon-helix-helix transcriptional regulator
MHIRLDKDLEEKLAAYAKQRNTNKSEAIRIALRRLFKQDHFDQATEVATQKAIERYFLMPRNYTTSSFFSTLYLLAGAYPQGKVKNVWGMVYQSTLDLTNKELFDSLKDEISRATKSHKEAKVQAAGTSVQDNLSSEKAAQQVN